MTSVRKIDKSNLADSRIVLSEVKNTLLSFQDAYPDIEKWYESKVLSGISDGNRTILLAFNKNTLAGFSILKKVHDEKKICTFFIYPRQRGNHIADCLFKKSFEELETNKPLITIPENKLKGFDKYIHKYDFELGDSTLKYRNDIKEFIFNGILH